MGQINITGVGCVEFYLYSSLWACHTWLSTVKGFWEKMILCFCMEKVTKLSCWRCVIASSCSSYWELESCIFCVLWCLHCVFRSFIFILGHICSYGLWCWAIFVPTVLYMQDFRNMASIIFSLDDTVKDIFLSVRSVKRGMKPVKHGMKAVKCGMRPQTKYDAKTGYVYDINFTWKGEDSCLEVKLGWKNGHKAVPINQK